MSICKDPNDQTQRNAAAIATAPATTASDGTLLPSFATAALEDYANLVSADIGLSSQNNTAINQFVRQYGQEAFNVGLVAINNALETFQNNLPNYPDLEIRLNTQLPITPIEYANYMSEFLQTPLTVVNLVNTNPTLVQSQLNDYYRDNFTQSAIGSFCSLMPSVFGTIGGFFNLVENAQQVFNDITDFINNFSLEDFSVKAIMGNLIGQIKEQILKVVDDMVSKVKGIIKNLSFESFMGQTETFVNVRIINRFIELKTQALAFFSEENIQNLKKKIENLINYAASIFKDPSLEEIQFLVYRFCSFSGQIESSIDLLKKPLDVFINNYQDTYRILRSSGSVATSEAVVNGGAIRYPDEERKAKINTGKEKEQSQSALSVENNPSKPPADITQEEWKEAEFLSSFEAVRNDSRFFIPVGSNRSWALNPIGQDLEDGWEMLNKELVARLIRLQRLFGKRITITSAYRSEKMQSVVNPGTRGFHIQGKALDLDWAGYNQQTALEFCKIARREAGFNGFGIYNSGNNTFVHLDIRKSFYVFRDDFGFKDQI